MSIHGLRELGWFLAGVAVALGGYLVTSTVATERAKLQTVEARIVVAKKEIRGLETEFDTRANMAQLQQWNGEALQLAAPNPDQYLASETQLANLDALGAGQDELQLAAVVPAGTPQVHAQPAVVTREAGPAKPRATGVAANVQDGTAKARNTAVAMLDDKLLSTATIDELNRVALTEKLKLR